MPSRRAPAVPAARHPFVDHCLELLTPLGVPRARRMFGGHGLYVDELFVALIIEERLYLKVDAPHRAQFEAAGCAPFVYEAAGRRVALGFWTAPDEAMDSPALMQPWGRLALQAAIAQRAAKQASAAPKRSPTAVPRRAATPRPKREA